VSISDFGFDEDDLNTAVRARVSAVTQNAMMLWDEKNVDPSATYGHPVVANGEIIVVQSNKAINRIRLIRQGASDSNVTITIER
jgi:hypothetical protein